MSYLYNNKAFNFEELKKENYFNEFNKVPKLFKKPSLNLIS